MNTVNSSVAVDASYAPEILIFRFTRWPSLPEQKALLKSLIDRQHLTPNSAAVLNITALQDLPDPDALAGGLAQAASNNSVLKRIACVVKSPDQERFVDTLRMMAPQPGKIRAFFTDSEALKWLVEKID